MLCRDMGSAGFDKISHLFSSEVQMWPYILCRNVGAVGHHLKRHKRKVGTGQRDRGNKRAKQGGGSTSVIWNLFGFKSSINGANVNMMQGLYRVMRHP